jgi:hypothetical protein
MTKEGNPMRRYAVYLVVGLAFTLAACSRQTAQTTEQPAGPPKGIAAPSGSSLSKIKEGMRMKEVSDLIGMPDDQNSYMTGKAFIPFYFGDDARRTSWYYKGKGRVVFAAGNVFGGGGGEVIRIDYDPSENGVAK